jgi:hypothetical protein
MRVVGSSNKSGSVLILVLWVNFVLAALTVAIGVHVSSVISVAHKLWGITESRALAEAGAAKSVAWAMSQTNAWDGISEDGWNCDEKIFSEQPLGAGSFSVNYYTLDDDGVVVTNIGIIGESGKFNLNSMSKSHKMEKVLVHLIASVGEMGLEDAQNITAEIKGGNNKDDKLTDGGNSDYYEPSSSSSSCTNATMNMKSVAELMSVKGVDAELYMRLLPYVTVYGGNLINLNCASEPVLAAVAAAFDSGKKDQEVYESVAAKIVDFQRSGGVFDKLESGAIKSRLTEFAELSGEEKSVWESMVGPNATIKSSAFRGISSGVGEHGGKAEVSVEFVFDRDSGKFVYWHEMQ